MKVLLAAGLMLLAVPAFAPPALAASGPAFDAPWYDAEYKSCDQDTTPEIVACVSGKAKAWQARLDTALKSLLAHQRPAQQERLKAAQKAWSAYRDANCSYYANGEGTIARVEAAECQRVLTQQRARELEQALQP